MVRTLSPETLTRLADLAGVAATVLADLASTRSTAAADGGARGRPSRPRPVRLEPADPRARRRRPGGGTTWLKAPLAIGIDIGGTKVAGGVVDAAGTVLRRARRDTPHRSTSPRVVEDTIVSVVEELLDEHHDDIAAVGIGAAGFVAADRATVVFAPHLSWRNEPLRQALGAGGAADLRRQRRQRRGLGRAPLRRRPRRGPPRHGQPRHRHRGWHRPRRARHPWAPRHRRGVRAHAGRAGRHPLRVRQQGLLGAVRVGQPRSARRGR